MDSNRTIDFPGFSSLYVLEEPGSHRAFRGKMDIKKHDAYKLTKGEIKPESSVKIKWASGGKKPLDIIHTTFVTPIIVHRRVIDCLSDNKLTGWDTYPVDIIDKDDCIVDDYFGLSVVGRCGEIIDSLSKKLEKDFPGGRFTVFQGLFFSDDSWDGSDIFMSKSNVGWVFITQSVKAALEKSKVKTLQYTSLVDFERASI